MGNYLSQQAHSSQAAMAQICSEYYKKLYTARDDLESSLGAQEVALRYLSDRISAKAKCELQAPISREELRTALWDMCPGKSPGPDGIVLEFYKVYWNLLELSVK